MPVAGAGADHHGVGDAGERGHIDQLDVVSPQWVALTGSKGEITVDADPQAAALIAAAPNRPAVLPLVHNSANAAFDSAQADALLDSPAARVALIAHLVDLAQSRGFGGYIFDLENLSPRAARLYPGFVAQARTALARSGRQAWVTAPFDGEGWPLPALQKASDAVVLMAYDQHYGTGDPGPPAAQDWFQTKLAERMAQLDPNRTVMALGAYGYDWTLPAKGRPGKAMP